MNRTAVLFTERSRPIREANNKSGYTRHSFNNELYFKDYDGG